MDIPFDNQDPGRYQIEIFPAQLERGDGVILVADRAGFRALADIFLQFAGPDVPDGTHIHLGYTEDTQPGPGWRIILGTGRLTVGDAP